MARSPCARVLACLALLLLTACSDYDRARNAYEGSDYALAIQRFEVLANAGHTQAQYDLAQIYFQGIGTAKDGQRGWYWLLTSAGGGNTAAMVQLGALFESGVGADRDFAAAAQWYMRAARLGHAVAAFNLAVMFVKGLGVPKDDVAALAWFRFSVKAGCAAARERVNELERELSKDEVARAEAMSLELQRPDKN